MVWMLWLWGSYARLHLWYFHIKLHTHINEYIYKWVLYIIVEIWIGCMEVQMSNPISINHNSEVHYSFDVLYNPQIKHIKTKFLIHTQKISSYLHFHYYSERYYHLWPYTFIILHIPWEQNLSEWINLTNFTSLSNSILSVTFIIVLFFLFLLLIPINKLYLDCWNNLLIVPPPIFSPAIQSLHYIFKWWFSQNTYQKDHMHPYFHSSIIYNN